MRYFSMQPIGCLFAIWTLGAPIAWSDAGVAKPNFTAFVSADAVASDGPRFAPADSDDLRASGDFLVTWDPGRFRLLAEFVASTEEAEFERLQLGWELTPNTVLWAGRFHQPASFWGYLYHHGQFAQTPITKPQVDDWEDSGGLLPQHFEGLLLDTVVPTSRGQRFDISLGVGTAPKLVDGKLEPFELARRRQGAKLPAYSARVTWYPNALQDPSFGVLLSHAEIENSAASLQVPPDRTHIDQNVIGVFVDYPSDDSRVTAIAYRVENKLSDVAGAPQQVFWSGYVQGERELPHATRAFGRIEFATNVGNSDYLRTLGSVARSRLVAGLRWDVSRKQALTVEVAHTRLATESTNELRLQWSAVIP